MKVCGVLGSPNAGGALSGVLPKKLRTDEAGVGVCADSSAASEALCDEPAAPPEAPCEEPDSVTRSDVSMIIATVPWRAQSLNRLLREVAQQTIRPGHLHVLLDGHRGSWPEGLRFVEWPGLTLHVHRVVPARGAGARWRLAETFCGGTIIVNLDDDIRISTRFVEKHVKAVERTGGAVSSGGYTASGRMIICTQQDPYDGPLLCAQTGAFSMLAADVRGLSLEPMADRLLGLLGDDEGLLSMHLWKSGVLISRVPETVGFDPSADDKRSQWGSAPGRCHKLRTALRELTGWPWNDTWC